MADRVGGKVTRWKVSKDEKNIVGKWK